MKKIIVFLGLVLLCTTMAQAQLNTYKYIVVPIQFNAFKNANQHQTSTLIKHLFTQEGFKVVYDNAKPADLTVSPCLGAWLNLEDDSNLFTTKTKLSIKDCNGALIFMSQEGRSKEKVFKESYKEAITAAFESFRGMNYTYEPPAQEAAKETAAAPVTLSFKNDVKSLEETAKKESPANQPLTKIEPAELQVPDIKVENGVLYAQPIEGGYQLVDSTPKVVYKLKKTSSSELFLATKDGKNGVVFKKGDQWFVEMDEKGSKPKELIIKF